MKMMSRSTDVENLRSAVNFSSSSFDYCATELFKMAGDGRWNTFLFFSWVFFCSLTTLPSGADNSTIGLSIMTSFLSERRRSWWNLFAIFFIFGFNFKLLAGTRPCFQSWRMESVVIGVPPVWAKAIWAERPLRDWPALLPGTTDWTSPAPPLPPRRHQFNRNRSVLSFWSSSSCKYFQSANEPVCGANLSFFFRLLDNRWPTNQMNKSVRHGSDALPWGGWSDSACRLVPLQRTLTRSLPLLQVTNNSLLRIRFWSPWQLIFK